MKSLFVKTFITLVIFIIIFQSVDFGDFIYHVEKSNGLFLLFALIFQYLSTLLATYRWRLIMQTLHYKEPFSFFYASYFKGTFFNQALPSTIGGDAVRVLDLINQGHRKKQAFFDILIDRVIGLFGLLIFSLIANLIFIDLFPKNIYTLILLINIGGIVGVIGVMGLSYITSLRHIRFLRLFFALSIRFRRILHTPKRLLTQTSLTLLVHLFTVFAFIAIAISVRIDDLHFWHYFVIVPSVLLITIIPISLAGWGIRESAMIGLFVFAGADQSKVLSISILYGFILILVGVYGAIYVFKER